MAWGSYIVFFDEETTSQDAVVHSDTPPPTPAGGQEPPAVLAVYVPRMTPDEVRLQLETVRSQLDTLASLTEEVDYILYKEAKEILVADILKLIHAITAYIEAAKILAARPILLAALIADAYPNYTIQSEGIFKNGTIPVL